MNAADISTLACWITFADPGINKENDAEFNGNTNALLTAMYTDIRLSSCVDAMQYSFGLLDRLFYPGDGPDVNYNGVQVLLLPERLPGPRLVNQDAGSLMYTAIIFLLLGSVLVVGAWGLCRRG